MGWHFIQNLWTKAKEANLKNICGSFVDYEKALKTDFVKRLLELSLIILSTKHGFPKILKDIIIGNIQITVDSEGKHYIIDVLKHYLCITSCIKNLDIAIIYIGELYKKKCYDKYEISHLNYLEYHHDEFNNKIMSTRDTCHKLIKQIYQLNSEGTTYKSIFEDNPEMKNEPLFAVYEKMRPIFKKHKDFRNKSSHEGDFTLKDFSIVQMYETMNVLLNNHEFLNAGKETETKKTKELLDDLLRSRNELVKEIINLYNCLCVPFCSFVDNHATFNGKDNITSYLAKKMEPFDSMTLY